MPTTKKQPILILFLLLSAVTWGKEAFSYNNPALPLKRGATAGRSEVRQSPLLSVPFYFVQNNGQIDQTVKYYGQVSGQAVSFTEEGIYLTLSKKEKGVSKSDSKTSRFAEQTVRFFPVGASHTLQLSAENQQKGRVNYRLGRDSKRWKTGVPTYGSVLYKEVYPGVDMKFYGKDRVLEYDMIIHPGADPSKVRLGYEGIRALRKTPTGALEVVLKTGDALVQKRPYIYQEINGVRRKIKGEFQLYKNTKQHYQESYGFQVASYDKKYPLVIDPTIVYSTYLGGDNEEVGNDIAVDGNGNVYVIGSTASTRFKTVVSPVKTYTGKQDVFVAKIDPAGGAFSYLTYLGGSEDDEGNGIAVDSTGNVYLAGSTVSTNFPSTATVFQPARGGILTERKFDAFVAKLNPDGSVSYATYLGGGQDDEGRGIAVDKDGQAYVTGLTHSSGASGSAFPTTPAAFQSAISEHSDAFITKINADGSGLIYSTFLGGGKGSETEGGFDEGNDIAVDSTGAAYITGSTSSETFPTLSASQSTRAGNTGNKKFDAFVTKMSADGSSLVYSTYLGGSKDEEGNGIAVDVAGNVYVTGGTLSSDFPTTPTSFQRKIAHEETTPPTDPANDAFVVKMDSSSGLLYATYLGGTDFDEGSRIAVDEEGAAYVTGATLSKDFPSVLPIQKDNAGKSDLFVTKIDLTGAFALFSTYLGGSGADAGHAIAIGSKDVSYVTGETTSVDFLTVSPLQADNAGKGLEETTGQTVATTTDAFIAKIGPAPPDTTPPTVLSVSPTDNATSAGLVSTTIRVTFSEPINPNVTDLSKDVDALKVVDPDGRIVLGKLTYDVSDKILTFTPNNNELKPSLTYTVTLTTTVQDLAGNPLVEYVWHFTTSDPPPPPPAPSGKKKSGCFIATAAFGSYLDPHVSVLRTFRDRHLITNAPGRALVDFYYEYSPPVADYIRTHEGVRTAVRWSLTPLVFGIARPGVSVVMLALFLAVLLVRKKRLVSIER